MKKQSSFTSIRILAAFALGMTSTVAAAQQAVSLEGAVKVERSLEKDGATTTFYEEPLSVVPGDRLVFTTSYRNRSKETVEDFVVTNPLPSAVMLSDSRSDFSVSVDGGQSFAALVDLSVAGKDGVLRPAQLSDVTHIRWTLARLEPGSTGSLAYRATVR